MGIYDREYYRDEPRRPGIGDWSAVTTLIVINVIVYVADMLSADHWIDEHLVLSSALFRHPWEAWNLLTYGFVHDPYSIMHILFNMFGLWLFGREIEYIYGKKEFYQLYLSLIVLSGLAWVALQNVLWPRMPAYALGASGAVMGITMIYILHFPHRTFLLFFAIPMPAWVVGILLVAIDLGGVTGTFQITKEHIANTAHLAGAFFGFVYYRTHWTLFTWPNRLFAGAFRRPRYRVHRGDDDRDARSGGSAGDQRQLQQRVDDILAKISREGEASLTADERRTLEEASRRYRGRQPGSRG